MTFLSGSPVEKWGGLFMNDFEDSVTTRFEPVSKKRANSSKEAGADYIQMTGSGSSVYGIFGGPGEIH